MADKCNYFDLKFVFNESDVDSIIQNSIRALKPGYVCSLDGNNFAISQISEAHKNILNSALVNNCDSSWLPLFVNIIHGTHYEHYCGADLFFKYATDSMYSHMFLGSSTVTLNRLRDELGKINPKLQSSVFYELPYLQVDQFDYENIADMINTASPDFVWISLGAPKQEQFMFNLAPKLKKGVMFGAGAIFNFYANEPGLTRAPQFMVKLKMEWLYRVFQEPKKQSRRAITFLKVIPKALYQEYKSKRVK